jgi:hypothetical protein
MKYEIFTENCHLGTCTLGFNLENSFIIMMKGKIILPLVTIMTLMLALISSSYCVAWADSDKDLL